MSVEELTLRDYRAYTTKLTTLPLGQHPSNVSVKAEWDHRFLGWYNRGVLVGVGLVLLRRLPRTPWWFAYFPEGPLLDWSDPKTVSEALPVAVLWLRRQRVCMVKVAPRIVVQRWDAATIRTALKDPDGATRWRDLSPTEIEPDGFRIREGLTSAGWRQYVASGPGFGGTLQPRYGFELDLSARTSAEVRADMNSQWRRNVTRSEKNGVVVKAAGSEGLSELHRLMGLSGKRAGFQPRDLAYFERMFDAMNAHDPAMAQVYLALNDNVAHAAMLMVRSGDRASYTFGGSDEDGRGLRPSNALQWRMVQDAIAEGLNTFDLRGVSDGLTPQDPEIGLTAFKAGLGATATEYVGEWDYLTLPLLGHVFRAYWNRRS